MNILINQQQLKHFKMENQNIDKSKTADTLPGVDSPIPQILADILEVFKDIMYGAEKFIERQKEIKAKQQPKNL